MLLLRVKVRALAECGIEFACDVAFEAADDFALCQALASAAGHVVAGGLVAGEPDDDDAPEGVVGVSVAAAVEAVAVGES